jgi:hypothetical protein
MAVLAAHPNVLLADLHVFFHGLFVSLQIFPSGVKPPRQRGAEESHMQT